MNIVEIIMNLPVQLSRLSEVLKDFIFTPVNIGGTEISLWLLLAGAGLIVLIIRSIIRS